MSDETFPSIDYEVPSEERKPFIGAIVGYQVNGRLLGPMIVTRIHEHAYTISGTLFQDGVPPHTVGSVRQGASGDIVSWNWI